MDMTYIPKETASYIPQTVSRLMKRIKSENFDKIALYGFGDNMKWLYRLLRQEGITPQLVDWRKKFIGYDCGGKSVKSILDLDNASGTLVVSCIEELMSLKDSFRFIINNKLHNLPVIYDRAEGNNAFHQEDPYKTIKEKARKRAISMIGDDQLFDLIQMIRATKNIPGDVVEFGSLYGGSGAILVESVVHYCQSKKKVKLFDTFAGIPKSKYGLDHRWNGSFCDNSYAEVKNAFNDCSNVEVIQGNICDTYTKANGAISFGYVASDTMETGEVLLNHLWENLTPGGIIAVCDYGSYPHCIPLTVMTDMFIEKIGDSATVFQPIRMGIYIIKNK